MCRVHPWPVGSVGGVEGSAAAAGDLRRSDGLKLHEASDDQGSQCPDDVLAVQQVRLEGAQQDVPLDAVVGDGLQDQVLPDAAAAAASWARHRWSAPPPPAGAGVQGWSLPVGRLEGPAEGAPGRSVGGRVPWVGAVFGS